MMFLYGILAMLAASAHCILMPHKLDAPKELVQVNFMNTHDESHRFRRSIDGDFHFPEVLIFSVNINGSDVTLTLKISHVNNLQPAVYTFSDNGRLVRKDTKDNSKRALYQDVNAGASYLVTCEIADPEQCELHGSFYHENNKYHMTSSQTAGLHELYNLGEESRNFTNDARTPPDHIANENTKPNASNASTRPKRALPDANIVEFLAITDDSVYNSFLAQTEDETEAVNAMTLYYSLLTNEVDLHYLSVPVVDPSLRIRVAFKKLFYATDCDMTPWSCDNTVTLNGVTYLDANNALDSFTAWRNNLRQSLITHDHAMAFTMKDFEFVSGGSATNGLAGQAWVGQVCRSWDTSVTEDNGFRTATIAAHELGHSLGAKHDSDSGPCPNSALNVMTTTIYRTTSQDKAEAQWTFSSCSVDYFRDHINGLWSNCMRSTDISDDALDGPLALPGEYYSLDQQCQMSGDSSVTSCTSGTRVSESACYSGTWCSSSSSCSSNSYRTYPMAGTPCGSSGENKWCYRGLCVAKTTTTTHHSSYHHHHYRRSYNHHYHSRSYHHNHYRRSYNHHYHSRSYHHNHYRRSYNHHYHSRSYHHNHYRRSYNHHYHSRSYHHNHYHRSYNHHYHSRSYYHHHHNHHRPDHHHRRPDHHHHNHRPHHHHRPRDRLLQGEVLQGDQEAHQVLHRKTLLPQEMG